MIWHSAETDEVLKALAVDRNNGLANGVADMRLEQYGLNSISNLQKPTFFKRFAERMSNKTVIALIAVALLSFIVSLVYHDGNPYSSLLVIAIVLLNALISAYQLHIGDGTLDTLKSVVKPTATVIRDGVPKVIDADLLVPGDILLLNEGDYITADARVLETNEFRCNELPLTAENVPIEKRADTTVEDITPLKERINMVYSGCSVIHGTAKAVVVATGLNTEIGHTSAILQQTGQDKLPLQTSLDNTARIVNLAILAVCAVYFIIGVIQNFTAHTFASMTTGMLVNAVALAVAAIPEGLPAIAAIVIALGIQRIIKDNIIIKRTRAIELLGKTTVICSDKTGILTRNKMTLSKIYDGETIVDTAAGSLADKPAMVLRLAATCSTLANDATEQTIKDACLDLNSMSRSDLDNLFPRLSVIPFDPDRKIMTTVNMINGRPCAIVKGAPELLLQKCSGCDREKILQVNNRMAEEALRVICIAFRPLDEIPANPNSADIEQNLIFAGLLGLFDPPRPEAVSATGACDRAGIRTVMITGDNILTAKAIARRIGILKDGTIAVTGEELAELTDAQLDEKIEKISVFARVKPGDKLRIVKAWQRRGELVTITGDSVEDTDALAAADIGCAVGRNGTDVARGSADIIITNNSFLSVVAAVRESRGLFENIRKSLSYLLSSNFGELLFCMLGILLFRLPPLTAAQLLWINLLTDCAPALSLSMERAESAVMSHKPDVLSRRMFSLYTVVSTAAQAFFIAAMTLISFAIGNKAGTTAAMTMAFATLGMIQIFHFFNIRTDRSVFSSLKGLFRNSRFMNITMGLILFIIIFLIFTPIGFLFDLTILNMRQFLICLGLSIAVIPFCELLKLGCRMFKNKR